MMKVLATILLALAIVSCKDGIDAPDAIKNAKRLVDI